MDKTFISALVKEIDECRKFISDRERVGGGSACSEVSGTVTTMERFLACYVRHIDGHCTTEAQRTDHTVKSRNEIVGDEETAVAHARSHIVRANCGSGV